MESTLQVAVAGRRHHWKIYRKNYFVTWPGELDLAPDAMHAQIKVSGEWVIS